MASDAGNIRTIIIC